MPPKPKHLSPEYAAWFQDPSVVAAYPHRPPYPPAVFDLLPSLIQDTPRAVLDIGCGIGDIARPLASLVERLDAVDISQPMLALGQQLPGGTHPNLTWIHSPVETAPLTPPYALITAGESLHWMAWESVLPRFAQVLTPHGLLAIIERDWDGQQEVVRQHLRTLFRTYSANRDFQPYDLITELTERRLFQPHGQQSLGPHPWQPTIAEYIECRHSQNGFSRERMGAEQSAAFDSALQHTLLELCQTGLLALRDDSLQLEVRARIVWGRPLPA
jgi:ubiquinone/menaquinone biosynthesis C-methylase UbiE